MPELIASGRIAAFILALTLLEILALVLYRSVTGKGPALADILPNILAGSFLLLAWSLSSTYWLYAAAALLGALAAHGTDLARRWRK
jgi:hypothetical protein